MDIIHNFPASIAGKFGAICSFFPFYSIRDFIYQIDAFHILPLDKIQPQNEKRYEKKILKKVFFYFQSIIFIRQFTRGGFEISGYIDYAHRLISENWIPFFKQGKTLWPRDSDLGYYHWRHGTVRSNISRNYKVNLSWLRFSSPEWHSECDW